jgi:hypothetical protein
MQRGQQNQPCSSYLPTWVVKFTSHSGFCSSAVSCQTAWYQVIFKFCTFTSCAQPPATALRAVAAKFLSTHFYRNAHFKKLQAALEKEFFLQVMGVD